VRLLVFGGRYYSDRSAAFWALDQVHAASPVTCVIHGGARGADALGDSWAHARGIYTERVRAEWETHGRRAGMLRNARMLAEFAPAYAVGFPGGRGTADMYARLVKAGVPVWLPWGLDGSGQSSGLLR